MRTLNWEPLSQEEREELNSIAEAVIGAAFEVSNVLGIGFLEKVYERALCVELRSRGLQAAPQVKIPVYFKGEMVGEYFADILVNGKLIIEVKCIERIVDEHLAQSLNYLAATGLRILLILNFQHAKVTCKRIVHYF